ncbi:MAG: TonB-dependent receptor [Acidobacteria bacterium]|nr:TonB-dependent receptor [Acidobacteriota bacterium]
MMGRGLAGIVLLAFLGSAPLAEAQSGRVAGDVVDETGGALPGATVTLIGPGLSRVVQTDGAGAFAVDGLPAGSYMLTIALSGFSPGTRELVVADDPVDLGRITLGLASFGDTVVVTASRSEVRLVDAPVTTSVISADTLEASPATNYGDVLRTVPGVNVVQLSARDVNVTSRQATGAVANSQLVLMDGRSVYLDFFGLVLWDLLPANTDDIEQIEVVRGPASATWGANAMTGAVNILTKSPRESVGTTVTFTGGVIDRDAGSTAGRSPGTLFGANATVTRAPTDRLAYRVSAGYFTSDAFPRPTGRIPVIFDPREPGRLVGGAYYPTDAPGAFGAAAFANRGTSQPKFDVRVDQELTNGRLTYAAGVAGTEGIVHSGVGPFDIQPGSYLGYGRVNYTRGDFHAQVFANFLRGDAPNLLLPDPATGQPVQLGFRTDTFDAEMGHSTFLGERHLLTYGGNVRQNSFDITIAPLAEDRLEAGAYLQDEIFLDPFRFVLGGRVDKFGNLATPTFSPRLAFIIKPSPDQSLTFSYNRAFRGPSIINNFLEMNILNPVDLSALAPFVPATLRPVIGPRLAQPFPLVVRAAGSDRPIGRTERLPLREESLTAYEVSYTGTLWPGGTIGAAAYLNRRDNPINFVPVASDVDPYTPQNLPPGWAAYLGADQLPAPLAAQVPGLLLQQMAQFGIFLPRTAFTYFNLGPTRQVGAELWWDQRFSRSASAWINYSWQAEPTILESDNPYLPEELTLPPTHRGNAGVSWNGPRYIASASVSAATDAFWSDVLTREYHGYSSGYTMVNGSVGMRWQDGAITTVLKGTNLLNRHIKQHIFGDILRRTVLLEVRFRM